MQFGLGVVDDLTTGHDAAGSTGDDLAIDDGTPVLVGDLGPR